MNDLLVPISLLRAPDAFGGAREGDCLRGSPVWRDDRLVALDRPSAHQPAQIVLPKLVEVHCHLDKCHSLHRLGSVGGDLQQAIERQWADKTNWTEADLTHRAGKGLTELNHAGCGLVRSHIDWGNSAAPPLSWHVLTEHFPDVQWAALTGIALMADPDFARDAARHVAAKSGVLGSFVLYHDGADRQAGLRNMFALADQHGLMLDFHVDEGLGAYDGLEAIADVALDTAFEGPILCGHAVALMDKSHADVARIAEKLARAHITICALPTTNLYLQGRTDGTPDRRGLTRLRELRDAGVSVTVGSDNVADAFCPTGQHDPMAALNLAILSAHLDPPLDRWLPMITTDASRALGQSPQFIDGAHRLDLLTSSASSTADLIAGRHPLLPLPLATGDTP